jgi:hypothetical protein
MGFKIYAENQSRANLKDLEAERSKSLTGESTVELVRRIVEGSDRLALKVFLDTRKLVRLRDEPPLLLPEFLLKLRDRLAPPQRFDIDQGKLADCIYDLTLAKYSNFPDLPQKKPDSSDYFHRATGPDCRNYYRAFLRSMQYLIDHGEIGNQAQEESLAGRVLQKKVYKNFSWSKLECERNTPFSIRYTWNVEGIKLTLWYPSYMTANEFREWLKVNIKNVNPEAPNEQGRIQDLIDANLKRGYHISLDKGKMGETLGTEEECPSIELHEGLVFVGSLAKAVAGEKVKNSDKLRPAIKRLGKKAIKSLILQIFSDIALGEYEATQIAQHYGISKATLSRFSGSMWFEKTGDNKSVTIPDLWQNTAGILAGNHVFMETVLTSGVAGKLEEVLSFIKKERARE